MKAIYKIWGLLPIAIAFVMTACSSDDNNTEKAESDQSVKIIPYMVTVNGETSTRATVDGDLKKLYFAAGDKLYISGTNISGVMDIQTGAGTASATFSGSLTYTGGGTPASDLTLNATLVSAQQNDGAEVTIAANKTVTVNYGTALCADVNEAIQKYSLLTGSSTYSAKSFTLTQQTAFLNFTITLSDGTATSTDVTATVDNVGGSARTGSITTVTEDEKIVAKFVAPVATQTLTNATISLNGSSPVIFVGSKALTAKVYHVKRTFHDLKKASAVIPASGNLIVYQSDNSNTTSNSITIGAGGELTLAGVNMEGSRIVCSGAATIVIADGSTNRVVNSGDNKCGIEVGTTGTMTIKGESEGTGSLTTQGGSYAAGIGTYKNGTCGAIEIRGGNITAQGGESAAGIGTGFSDTSPSSSNFSTCGNITISGGTVRATGGGYGAGIGSGRSLCNSSITISGGTVIATGGSYGAGLGGGCLFNSNTSKRVGWGDIIISGGNVTATKGGSGSYGSGAVSAYDIGAGGIIYNSGSETSTCGTVTITGGTVTATNNLVKDYPSWPN